MDPSGTKQYFYLLMLLLMVAGSNSVPANLPVLKVADNFDVFWGYDHVTYGPEDAIHVRLDATSGAGFQSHQTFQFGYFNARIKLVPGNSAGVVASFYLHSNTPSSHDEIDFEFLGNVSGQPYSLQSNIFASGRGEREQRIDLWFDPSLEFHSYSILWNPEQIRLMIDGETFRVFKNLEAQGVGYPRTQSMGLLASIFDGSSWATGPPYARIPINFALAPFEVSYQGFQIDGCQPGQAACASKWWQAREYSSLSTGQINRLREIRKRFLSYDYCTDTARNAVMPVECRHNEYFW